MDIGWYININIYFNKDIRRMGKKIEKVQGLDEWIFGCPGCDGMHYFDKRWTYDGNDESPTLSPSIVTEGNGGEKCHLVISGGVIEFLDDCEHELRGMRVHMFDVDSFLATVEEQYTYKPKIEKGNEK
jgi:hypothetical protein